MARRVRSSVGAAVLAVAGAATGVLSAQALGQNGLPTVSIPTMSLPLPTTTATRPPAPPAPPPPPIPTVTVPAPPPPVPDRHRPRTPSARSRRSPSCSSLGFAGLVELDRLRRLRRLLRLPGRRGRAGGVLLHRARSATPATRGRFLPARSRDGHPCPAGPRGEARCAQAGRTDHLHAERADPRRLLRPRPGAVMRLGRPVQGPRPARREPRPLHRDARAPPASFRRLPDHRADAESSIQSAGGRHDR